MNSTLIFIEDAISETFPRIIAENGEIGIHTANHSDPTSNLAIYVLPICGFLFIAVVIFGCYWTKNTDDDYKNQIAKLDKMRIRSNRYHHHPLQASLLINGNHSPLLLSPANANTDKNPYYFPKGDESKTDHHKSTPVPIPPSNRMKSGGSNGRSYGHRLSECNINLNLYESFKEIESPKYNEYFNEPIPKRQHEPYRVNRVTLEGLFDAIPDGNDNDNDNESNMAEEQIELFPIAKPANYHDMNNEEEMVDISEDEESHDVDIDVNIENDSDDSDKLLFSAPNHGRCHYPKLSDDSFVGSNDSFMIMDGDGIKWTDEDGYNQHRMMIYEEYDHMVENQMD